MTKSGKQRQRKPRMNGDERGFLGICHSERSEESLSSRLNKLPHWVAAPQGSLSSTLAIQGVFLRSGEDVEWAWTHTPAGSFVSGYRMIPAGPHTIYRVKRKS
jgi:hypothetical protein